MNISPINRTSASSGHALKSVLAMPVVVIIETTWNAAWRIASWPRKMSSPTRIPVTTTVAITQESDVEPELRVAQQHTRPPTNQRAMHQRKVRAGDRHEDRDRPLRGRTERLRGACLGGEPARRHRRQRVRDGFEEVHARVDARPTERREDRDLEQGQGDVERPQPPGGVADPRLHLLDLRARHLRLEQLPSSDAQPREHGDREDDDPHAAEPLAELTPEQHRVRQALDVGQHCRARRRESGHRLEVGIDRIGELVLAREDVRERAYRRRGKPRDRHDEETFTDAEAAAVASGMLDRPAEQEGDRSGAHERPGRLRVEQRDERWR